MACLECMRRAESVNELRGAAHDTEAFTTRGYWQSVMMSQNMRNRDVRYWTGWCYRWSWIALLVCIEMHRYWIAVMTPHCNERYLSAKWIKLHKWKSYHAKTRSNLLPSKSDCGLWYRQRILASWMSCLAISNTANDCPDSSWPVQVGLILRSWPRWGTSTTVRRPTNSSKRPAMGLSIPHEYRQGGEENGPAIWLRNEWEDTAIPGKFLTPTASHMPSPWSQAKIT